MLYLQQAVKLDLDVDVFGQLIEVDVGLTVDNALEQHGHAANDWVFELPDGLNDFGLDLGKPGTDGSERSKVRCIQMLHAEKVFAGSGNGNYRGILDHIGVGALAGWA